jgi:hypothetical protein
MSGEVSAATDEYAVRAVANSLDNILCGVYYLPNKLLNPNALFFSIFLLNGKAAPVYHGGIGVPE